MFTYLIFVDKQIEMTLENYLNYCGTIENKKKS
jgi:hypothetical protein